jgi:hypothetical protein
MKMSFFVKTTVVLAVMIAMAGLFLPVRAMGNTADDALLNTLPEDCMFCLRINNFSESLAKMDSYLSGASPVSLAMLANMQLMGITGDPMMSGIDMAGDFAFFAIPPQADQTNPSAGMLIPVKSFSEFVKTNPNCSSVEGGLTLLSPANSPIGNILLAPVGETYALAVPEMNKTVMATLQKTLAGTSKIANRLSRAQANEAVAAPAWAFVDLAGMYEKYHEQALGMMQMMQMGMSQDKAMADMMAFQFKMFAEMFKSFAGQADSMTLTLRPTPAMLSLDTAFRAKDGTELANMMAGDSQPADYTFTGYLDNSNAINGLVKIDAKSMKLFYDNVFDVMADAAEETALKEQTEKLKTLTHQALDAMGEELAFSYSYAAGKPPFQLQEVVAVKDSAAVKAMMDEAMDYTNDFYKAMNVPASLTYTSGVSSYQDTPIDVVTVSVEKTNDPNNPMQQEMAKLYGDDFKYYVAQTSDKLYVTMGPDSEQTLKTLMDQSASAPAPGDIKIAMETLKGTPYNDFVCSVNVIKLVQGMGDMMQTFAADAPEAGMFAKVAKNLDMESQSTLIVGGDVSGGQMAVRWALPKQHLIEIVTMGMQMQQQMTAPQQTGTQK